VKLYGFAAGVGLLALLAAGPSAAQSSDASAGTAAAPKPTAPVQDSSNTTTSEKKKPKKVWTNDEIGSVNGGVSVVGDGKPGDPSRSATEGSGDSRDARAETVRNYRDQIRQLRDQMAAADRRIEQLKSFKGENTSPSGGFNINQGYNMVPVEEQVKQLQEKKKKLEAKIEDVEVEARKNGVDPGELR